MVQDNQMMAPQCKFKWKFEADMQFAKKPNLI
jgi:hypothetical protein